MHLANYEMIHALNGLVSGFDQYFHRTVMVLPDIKTLTGCAKVTKL